MKIALIGATGSVGSRVLAELLSRGHEVTGLSRHPEKLTPQERLKSVQGDIAKPDELGAALHGHDAVISSVRFLTYNVADLLAAVKASEAGRLVVVGGAGSLKVASGQLLADTPAFPAAAKPEADAGKKVLEALRGESALNWTFVSPSALFAPGERTGHYRLGEDILIVGEDGKSRISQEDYAIALVDELESAKHPRQRITVGY
ncbi:NAD(P)-dependent oxidoreductase [Variovorax sp. J22R133]|uniref:NAD(P)-dependent oxidoreductase n=1 Tax=Variovorax brevis TaxID=3053503 RepID=UPI00257600D4|nr:NAD(P)-dependent oxidoreductase [Variovorax sp. J22R133]MDM0116082.1 NAD(P)-dependent oxidoreductase [Variovorax sp. J22R133]